MQTDIQFYIHMYIDNGILIKKQMNVEIMQWDLRLLRPRLSVDLIKGLQMSRAKPKLTQI
jgi:hypothetical protein